MRKNGRKSRLLGRSAVIATKNQATAVTEFTESTEDTEKEGILISVRSVFLRVLCDRFFLRTLKPRRLHEQDREHRQREAEHRSGKEKEPELAIVRWHLDRAARVLYLARYDVNLIQVFRSELSGRQ